MPVWKLSLPDRILSPGKIAYDSEVDVLRTLFSNAPIEENDEGKPIEENRGPS
jgi:hypothetical protein